MTPELYQFAFSHYSEKARWALDWKGIAHVRRSLLPGPHRVIVKRLTGQYQVPVLRSGGQIVAGSARIIDHLERLRPRPPLYPSRDDARAEALDVARWFDEELGVPLRLAFFHEFLADTSYAARCFSTGQGAVGRAIYRVAFPMVRVIMRRDMHVDAAGAAHGVARTMDALDRVAERAGRDGHLVGDVFTVADLTAASLLSVVAFPKESPVPVPEPRSPVIDRWLARFAGHPGAEWVATTYRRHRGGSAEIAARGSQPEAVANADQPAKR